MAQIVLITGKPRIGKTAFAVEMVMFDDYYKGRKLFSNVNGLDIPHHQPPEGHTWHDMHKWLTLPENVGSVVLFDEVQNLYPARSAGSRMPENVAWLNVHGHHAIDLIFISQGTTILDVNLRTVVGKHIHITANRAGGLTRLEWNEVATNPTKQSKSALSRVHHIRDEVFKHYKSAEAHIKHDHVVSPWVKWLKVSLFLAPVMLLLAGWAVYTLMYKDIKEQAENTDTTTDTLVASDVLSNQMAQSALPQQNPSLTPEMFVPTLAERPESKPIYDGIRQVKSYERVAGCVDSGSKCTCYSDQATQLSEITTAMCKDYVRNGMPFDPFRDSNPEPQQRQQQPLSDNTEPQQQPTVLTLGGKSEVPKHQDYPERLRDIQ